MPAPPAPWIFHGASAAAGAVSAIRFADLRNGWAFGPGLWATHDGGRTWHRVSIGGASVVSLEAARGRAIAAFGSCDTERTVCTSRVYTSAAGTDVWSPVPGTAVTRAGETEVVVSGGTGYIAATTVMAGRPALLTGPTDGSAAWQRLAAPCTSFWHLGAALAAGPGGSVVLACASEPSAGNQWKRAYLSADGGRTWRRLADPPVGGYLGPAAVTPAGTILISGPRSDVYISWDGGRSWHTSASLIRAQAGADGLAAAMTSSTQGFAITPGGGSTDQAIWFTYDDGHTWTPVTVR